jgi:hypothetical protein
MARLAVAGWTVTAFMVSVCVFGHGCGGPDCTETLTCADAPDVSNGGSDVATDMGMDTTRGMDGGGIHDAPFDSFVLPEGGDVTSIDGCPLGENCTNGIDDNCDGKIDCADPLCVAGYACYAPAPAGWLGPIELYTGGSSPPGCGTPYANDVVDGNGMLSAPMAQCTCACGPVGGVDCDTSVDWTVYTDPFCTTSCGSGGMPPGNGNFCESTGGCGVESFKVQAGAPLLNLASCAPNPTTTVPPYSWQEVARGCGYSGPNDMGGCMGGALCLAKPASPFGAAACIYASGDLGCPAGPYGVKKSFFTSVSDTRGCTQCTCGAPTDVTCALNGSLTTYAVFGSPCSQPIATGQANGTCVSSPGGAGIQGFVTATPSGGSCAAASVSPTGSATPTGPTTVCCTM